MKAIKLLPLFLITLMSLTYTACSDDGPEILEETQYLEMLLANKWEYVDEIELGSSEYTTSVTVYFLTESTGLEYEVTTTLGGSNRTKNWVYFDYAISDNDVLIKYENGRSGKLTYSSGCLKSSSVLYEPDEMTSSDYSLIKSLAPLTGSCGDNLTWSYDKRDSTMTIQGQGAMSDFKYKKQPWKNCTIRKVVIQEGVTSVGEFAFDVYSDIESVSLPSTLQKIGKWAFDSLAVTSIKIPKRVEEIGTGAFAGCENLKTLTFEGFGSSSSLQKIGNNAFRKTAVSVVKIPKSVKELSGFFRCEQLAEVVFESSSELQKIGSSTFYNTAISQIEIPQSVEVIERDAFAYTQISSIFIPKKVKELSGFNGCEKLTEVTFETPSELQIINSKAFSRTAITQIEIPENVEEIKMDAFYRTQIASVKIPKNVKFLSGFDWCKNLKEVIFESSSELQKVGAWAFSNSGILQIEIPQSVEVIDEYAFRNCKNLTSVEIDDENKLTTIADYAFANSDGAMNISSLTLNASLDSIGKEAFSECIIKSLKLNGVKSVDANAFANSKIKSLTLGEGLEEVGEKAFYGYLECKELKLPKSLKAIGPWAFKGSFSSVSIGSGVTQMDISPFISSASSGKMYVNLAAPIEMTDAIITDNGTPKESYWTLYVPKGRKSAYASAVPWNSFKSIIEDASLEGGAESSDDNTDDGNDDSNTESFDYTNVTYSIKGVSYKMVLVDGGYLPPFYIMQTELPEDGYFKIGNTDIGYLDMNMDGTVTKYEFRNFIGKLREVTGLNFRQPTPDEWQFAAQGGSKTSNYTYSGSNTIDEVAWYSGNSNSAEHAIATKKPNELGLYDMSGNYAEVCSTDEYDVDGLIYGGCWKDAAKDCTVTSYKQGSKSSNNIPGTTVKELNAYDARYIAVRLVYSVPE